MSKRPDLRECPFCGAAAWFGGYTVQCKDCGSLLVSGEHGESIALWNRRVLSPEVTTLVNAARLGLECIKYCRRAHKDSQSGEGFPAELVIEAALAPFTEKGPKE